MNGICIAIGPNIISGVGIMTSASCSYGQLTPRRQYPFSTRSVIQRWMGRLTWWNTYRDNRNTSVSGLPRFHSPSPHLKARPRPLVQPVYRSPNPFCPEGPATGPDPPPAPGRSAPALGPVGAVGGAALALGLYEETMEGADGVDAMADGPEGGIGARAGLMAGAGAVVGRNDLV